MYVRRNDSYQQHVFKLHVNCKVKLVCREKCTLPIAGIKRILSTICHIHEVRSSAYLQRWWTGQYRTVQQIVEMIEYLSTYLGYLHAEVDPDRRTHPVIRFLLRTVSGVWKMWSFALRWK